MHECIPSIHRTTFQCPSAPLESHKALRQTVVEDEWCRFRLDLSSEAERHGDQTDLGHEVCQVPIAQRIAQVPANAQEDNLTFEVPPI
jgi:hypothetical protein